MCLNYNDFILLSKIYYTATYFRSSPSSYFFSKAILEHHHLKAKLRINKTTLAFVSFTVDTRTFCKQKMKVWIIIVQNKYKAKIQLKHYESIMIDFCIARLNCLFDHLIKMFLALESKRKDGMLVCQGLWARLFKEQQKYLSH